MAEISLRNVKKSYGQTAVIHGIDLEVSDGEFIVIVGPSGCGKSTLLRMVAGLEVITEGEISIAGRVVNRVEPKDRDIAMVFQNYALYPHMKVYDNMAYGLKIAGLSKSEIDQRVQEAAKMLELEALLQRRPRELSGGQRQRVAMGRAIVRNPSVFLFDEPLSNLDAKLRVQMRLEIKRLQNSLGTTSLYVTHDQVEAMTLADRLVVMNGGVAEQIDSPLTVYEHPASIFVAGFIGSPAMNFLPCQLNYDAGDLSHELSGSAVRHDLKLPSGSGQKPVTLGIRPEHLLPVAESEADFRFNVELVEALGADSILHGRIEGAGPESYTLRLATSPDLKSGTTLALRAQEGMLHLFDRETGKRLLDV